jgi:hypothetical protein
MRSYCAEALSRPLQFENATIAIDALIQAARTDREQ